MEGSPPHGKTDRYAIPIHDVGERAEGSELVGKGGGDHIIQHVLLICAATPPSARAMNQTRWEPHCMGARARLFAKHITNPHGRMPGSIRKRDPFPPKSGGTATQGGIWLFSCFRGPRPGNGIQANR
jgi:hypothetical protein